MNDTSKDTENQFPEIDKLIHEPARLKLVAQLYIVESADFVFLTRQTGLTQANVSGHLSKLELADYIDIKKRFVGKRPQTLVSLTRKGREAFKNYTQIMRQMFEGLDE